MLRYENDEKAVARVVDALSEGEVIDHGTARTIAAGYNDRDTATFVTTGAIPVDDDEYDAWDGDGPAEWLMDAIRHGVDSATLGHDAQKLDALYAYLADRVADGETGPVEGWVSMDVRRHVDYPHQDGALPECWCADDDQEV